MFRPNYDTETPGPGRRKVGKCYPPLKSLFSGLVQSNIPQATTPNPKI